MRVSSQYRGPADAEASPPESSERAEVDRGRMVAERHRRDLRGLALDAWRWCQKYGWKTPRERWSAGKQRRMIAAIRRAKDRGLSNSKIAAALGCSKSQVQRLS
jgi:AraC-like DNA-binding protein